MRTPAWSRRYPGFTLLEVLLVAFLLGIVVSLVCEAFISGVRFNAAVQRRAEEESELVRLSEQMRFQLLALNTSPVRKLPIEGQSDGENRDEINFVTSYLMRHGGIGDVAYRIEDDEHGRPYLAYREHAFVYPDNSLANLGPFKPLSHLVSGLLVEYQATTSNPNVPGQSVPQWVHTWDSTLMPARIRVTLYLGVKEGSHPYVLEVEPALVSVTPLGEIPGVGSPSPSISPSASVSPSAVAAPTVSMPAPMTP